MCYKMYVLSNKKIEFSILIHRFFFLVLQKLRILLYFIDIDFM